MSKFNVTIKEDRLAGKYMLLTTTDGRQWLGSGLLTIGELAQVRGELDEFIKNKLDNTKEDR